MVLANNLEQWINKKWDERDARNRAAGLEKARRRVARLSVLSGALGTNDVSRLSLGASCLMSLCLAATTVLFMRTRIDPAPSRISVPFL